MKILVDLDGVICEYDFKSLFKKFFGVTLPKNGIYAYDLADVAGVSHEEIDYMFHKQVWGKPKFIEDGLETLREWKGKHTLLIFSNRVTLMGAGKLGEWLVKHSIPWDDIADGTGHYDFHIDDSPAKLATTNSKIKLLYSQPWNLHCLDIKKQLYRVNSWAEIRRIIDAV